MAHWVVLILPFKLLRFYAFIAWLNGYYNSKCDLISLRSKKFHDRKYGTFKISFFAHSIMYRNFKSNIPVTKYVSTYEATVKAFWEQSPTTNPLKKTIFL